MRITLHDHCSPGRRFQRENRPLWIGGAARVQGYTATRRGVRMENAAGSSSGFDSSSHIHVPR